MTNIVRLAGSPALAIVLLAGMAACTKAEQSQSPETAAAPESRACSVDAFAAIPDLTISSATHEETPAPHCLVNGVIGTEIGFLLRLPDDWNGKFIMGGSGGFGGNFMNAGSRHVERCC